MGEKLGDDLVIDQLSISLAKAIKEIVRTISAEEIEYAIRSSKITDADSVETVQMRDALKRIAAKENLTANEAALLLSCSPSHLRNLVSRAKRGESTPPIPHRDLDGLIVFPREELLNWSTMRKAKRKKGFRAKQQ